MSVATSDRAESATQRLAAAGVELLLVTDLVNVRYLTGYTGSNGVALIGPEERKFLTDFRYVEQAAEEVERSFERVRAAQDLIGAVPEALGSRSLRLGFEDAHMSVREHARLAELLGERVTLVPVTGLVEALRAVKEPGEIERLRAAASLADAALLEVTQAGLVGRTEREVALALEDAMRRLGAERSSFDPIVAAGAHGALPHASPRDVEIAAGQMVVIDWGAQLDGYPSDCTRTFATGEPGESAREIYRLVLDAQLAALDAVRAGAEARDVDTVARELIAAAGHAERFGHGLGHGVGLEIHEDPRLTQRSEATLVPGNVVTVEPGVYLPGEFGVRIEDLVVVTTDGPDILTGLTKELTVVG